MKKSQITRILVDGSPELAQRLCVQIGQNYSISMIKSPEKSLIMAKARDSVSQQPFNMGEVLVTECTVSIGERYGFGILMGDNADRAYHLAVVDAALNANLPETGAWTELLLAEEQVILAKRREEQAQVMKTKVNFDTMEEYHAKR